MVYRLCVIVGVALAWTLPAPGAETFTVSGSEELADALSRAQTGDAITLGADIEWTGPRAVSIPSGVTLDGNGHTLTSLAGGGNILNQSGASDVTLRNVTLRIREYSAWSIQVKDGDLKLVDSDIHCRFIAWEKGAITLENCSVTIQIPRGNDHSEPIGIYGGGASFTATNSRFYFGWDELHVGGGYFHNFGGDPASQLTLRRCTVLSGPDPNANQASRHQAVFLSDNAAGPAFVTTVTDSLIGAEVGAVFRSRGKGAVHSAHNNNAGMLRNPGIMAGGNPDGVRFHDAEDSVTVTREAEIEEFNPFADGPGGDFRLLAGTQSATAASDGGPVGANPEVTVREHNACNLDLDAHVLVGHRTQGYTEALFDGWKLRRDTDRQYAFAAADGLGGPALRLQMAYRLPDAEGAPRSDVLEQAAWQSFVTVPGYVYTIRAYARRGAVGLAGDWSEARDRTQAILAVAEGHTGDTANPLASTVLDTPENQWQQGEVTVTAPSTRLTIQLIHRTTGGWNAVDWDRVSIHPKAPAGARVPEGLAKPVLGYLNTIPPESSEERAERHRRVAERRAGVPIIVHRGASNFAPENSLEAYSIAMDRGADGCEFDPRATQDGVLYTFHDDSVERILRGGGKGREMTYFELASIPFKDPKGPATNQSRVPTIVSFFELARKRAMLLHFDVKEWGVEDELIGLLDAMDMWDHVVLVNPSDNSNRIRFHPRAKLIEYKGHKPNWDDAAAVKAYAEGPGEMIFMQYDPAPAAKALGRPIRDDQPLPEGLRAWWWPDGTSEPVLDAD